VERAFERMTSKRLRVACIGGGPGGIFLAGLLKSANPAHEVVVFERNGPEDTFGFGVVFSDATLGGINDADSKVLRSFEGLSEHWDAIEVRLHGERFRCGGNGMAAITRAALLVSGSSRQAIWTSSN